MLLLSLRKNILFNFVKSLTSGRNRFYYMKKFIGTEGRIRYTEWTGSSSPMILTKYFKDRQEVYDLIHF